VSGPAPVIAGLGITDVGRVYDRTAPEFAADAVRLAAADAGLALPEIDGLLVSSGLSNDVKIDLQRQLGLRDLRLLSEMQGFGSTAASMVSFAAMMVRSGAADVVACVHADAPLVQDASASAAYKSAAVRRSGWRGMTAAVGVLGANHYYALAARRHMLRYGTTHDQLGAIAVGQREWAAMNPLAQLREPITLADYHASRWIAEPLHLLDCCVVSNGGIAVIVTSAERAAALRQPPVHVLGWAQAHPGRFLERNDDLGLVTGAVQAGPAALGMAGVTLDDIDIVELYDCYTITVLLSLEDYGFCAKGEGGELVASGVLGPHGKLKANTGGGQLSSYYLWGMTPLSEAVIQARGQAGERQVDDHELVLVSGNGGVFDHHSTLVLGSHA
jgi:acetyl-CoA acetyltransferase